MANLEAALAGESMAHTKYRYFAAIARAEGNEEVARVFEETAAQEVQHALGHLDLLYPKSGMTTQRCLQMAIEGETYEYTEMYPGFLKTAQQEGHDAASAEIKHQIAESKEHAECSRPRWKKRPSASRHWPKGRTPTPTSIGAQLAKVTA
jgi:rubrerythrin